jgi:hypothetical protein
MGSQRTPQVLGGCDRREQYHRVRALLVGVFGTGGEGGFLVSLHVAGLGGCGYGRRLMASILSPLHFTSNLSHTPLLFYVLPYPPISSNLCSGVE